VKFHVLQGALKVKSQHPEAKDVKDYVLSMMGQLEAAKKALPKHTAQEAKEKVKNLAETVFRLQLFLLPHLRADSLSWPKGV